MVCHGDFPKFRRKRGKRTKLNFSGVVMTNSYNTLEVKPEFVRVDKAIYLFGIGRTKLYTLMKEGKVKAFTLRERGQIKGTRLISYDSLKQFIENQQSVANN